MSDETQPDAKVYDLPDDRDRDREWLAALDDDAMLGELVEVGVKIGGEDAPSFVEPCGRLSFVFRGDTDTAERVAALDAVVSVMPNEGVELL